MIEKHIRVIGLIREKISGVASSNQITGLNTVMHTVANKFDSDRISKSIYNSVDLGCLSTFVPTDGLKNVKVLAPQGYPPWYEAHYIGVAGSTV